MIQVIFLDSVVTIINRGKVNTIPCMVLPLTLMDKETDDWLHSYIERITDAYRESCNDGEYIEINKRCLECKLLNKFQ